MKKIILAFCSATLLFACNSGGTNSGDTKDSVTSTNTEKTTTSSSSTTEGPEKKEGPKTPKAMPDSATMMKNWQAYMTPGDVHKMMASWDGTWNGEITMWMAPGAPPETTKGTTTNKMAMGGRYQISNHSSTMMGMPFEGMGTLAYDNSKKVFVSSWIDNMGTGIMKLEGKWDDATKSIDLKGKCVAAYLDNGEEMEMREVFKVVDDNNHVMEMYGPGPDGKEYKTMEIKFTRKK